MEFWLTKAREHSKDPLPKCVVDEIWSEWKKNEWSRRDEALRIAYRYGSSGKTFERGSMEAWIRFAESFSHGFLESFMTFLLGTLIRIIFELRPHPEPRTT